MNKYRKFFPLFFCFLFFPYISNAQVNHWITLETATYNDISFSVQTIHQPSIADSIWFQVIIDNQNPSPQEIISSKLEVKLSAFNKNKQIIKEGMFSSSNPSDFIDNFSSNLFEPEHLAKGVSNISKFPSACGSSILGMPEKDFFTVEVSISLVFQLKGAEALSFEWDHIHFEIDWYIPNPNEIYSLKQNLKQLLNRPQYNSYQFNALKSLLDIDVLAKEVKAPELLAALQKYADYPEAKIALLRHIDKNYSENPIFLDYFEKQLQVQNVEVLHDLKEIPSIWKSSYMDLFSNWLKVSNLGMKVRIMDALFLRQNHWRKYKNFPKELSDAILADHSDILYALPTQLDAQQLKQWASLASSLGKTGDPTAISIMCPFLQCQTQLWSRDILLYASSMRAPRPTRACDIALEAILHLQNKDIEESYYKSGYIPPYLNGEAEIIITRVRDNLIREISLPLSCNNY